MFNKLIFFKKTKKLIRSKNNKAKEGIGGMWICSQSYSGRLFYLNQRIKLFNCTFNLDHSI
jgi:hypothetical protein